MNRGDRREDIFQDGEDRKRFLSTLGEAGKKTEWEVHFYFRKELLAAAVERVGASHYGSERHETGEQKAERIVTEELKGLRWTEQDLRQQSKGDKGKVAVARRLRKETTMSLKWIAKRLQMGS